MRLHQLIYNSEAAVDHINGDTLDNRKANLRAATRSQNQMNKRKYGNFSSNFKGVSWNKRTKKWVAYIKLNRKKTHLGYFRDEMKAAQAYDTAARELFKEYARLNFPVAGEQCALTASIEEVAA